MSQHPHRQHASARARRPRSGGISESPDRVALWAVFMAVIAMVAAAASAHADGGVGPGEGSKAGTGGECGSQRFGARELERGDCGVDVRTLNWILGSRDHGAAAPLGRRFEGGTEDAVRRFQRKAGLGSHGRVDRGTRKKLIGTMRKDVATWYGPGFYGNRTACGVRLTRRTVGVAHRGLPCGTKVAIKYRGRFLTTRVIDRGPYARGVKWDLTNGARKRLGVETTVPIRAAIVR